MHKNALVFTFIFKDILENHLIFWIDQNRDVLADSVRRANVGF